MWFKKVKNTVPWTHVIVDLNEEKHFSNILWKRITKTNQTEVRIEKVIKRKGDKLYVKWKGYNNSFNSCPDKNDIIISTELFPRTISL